MSNFIRTLPSGSIYGASRHGGACAAQAEASAGGGLPQGRPPQTSPANTPVLDPRVGIPAEFLLRMTIANRHPEKNVAKRGRQPLF
ncbi:hypothetical protein, partial [Alistipes communis]|uniref:hypothetical protein n=1 Tax=Alistipes communis TaxID=2585118 RepID=UPI00242FA3AA